jgi:hypothetical protein
MYKGLSIGDSELPEGDCLGNGPLLLISGALEFESLYKSRSELGKCDDNRDSQESWVVGVEGLDESSSLRNEVSTGFITGNGLANGLLTPLIFDEPGDGGILRGGNDEANGEWPGWSFVILLCASMWGVVDAADIARLNRVLVGVLAKDFSPLSSCWPCCLQSSFWLLAFAVSSGAEGGSLGFLNVIMALTDWPAKTTGFSNVISTWTVEDSRLGNGININKMRAWLMKRQHMERRRLSRKCSEYLKNEFT